MSEGIQDGTCFKNCDVFLAKDTTNLVRSGTRPTSGASSRHPSRTANAKPFSDASVQMQTSSHQRFQSLQRTQSIPPNALGSKRTIDHGSTETKEGRSRKFEAGFKDREAPRSLSTRKDSSPLTSSIAQPLRREETVRATERIRALRLPVPLQYALDGDTTQPSTSALPFAREMS